MQRIVALSTPQAKKCNEIYALENRGKYDGIDSVLLGVDTMPYLYRICAESVRLHLSMPNLCVYAYSMPYQRIRNSLTINSTFFNRRLQLVSCRIKRSDAPSEP